MIPSKLFLFYLLDTATGKAYYRDQFGVTQLVNIATADVPVDLVNAPANWLGITLAFERSMEYFGLNRVYSTPMEFVRQVKDIIQELVLQGVGVETPLTLAVFRYNQQPLAGQASYQLYIKAPLDLPDAVGTVFESLTCNLMEGGVSQLLKNYENTVLSIPCDGSLPEHIKANYDGVLVEEKYYYQIMPRTQVGEAIPETIYLNNINESYGVVHANQRFQTLATTVFADVVPDNYSISFNASTYLTIQGEVTVEPFNTNPVGYVENFAVVCGTTVDSTKLVIGYAHVGQITTVKFKGTVLLQPGEKAAVYFTNLLSQSYNILSGNFSLEFATKPRDSRPWGLTAYDVWRRIGKQICELASTTAFPISYEFTSDLLQQYLNFFITSGDALRASNDPTYQRYYYLDSNNQISFGPVIKISLKQFYESMRVPLMAAVGRGVDVTGKDVLFFETLESVFDSSVVNYSLGEVSKLGYELQSKDFRFSDLYIGWEQKSYDQKAGKYEWNTTLKMKAPIKSFEKVLNLVSPTIRTDIYGMQRLLAANEVGASTSTTRNDSDNSVFLTVIDRVNFIYDYFRAYFVSLISQDTNPANTNVKFKVSQSFQLLDLPTTDGEYFQVNKDFAIFVFAVTGYAAIEVTTLKMDAIVNSINHSPLTPADTVTVKYWRNGVVLYQNTTTVTGVDTPIDPTGLGSTGGAVFNQFYQYSDCIYMTVETSLTAVVQINTVSIDIGSYVNMAGANIPIEAGLSQKLVSMPTVIPSSTPFDGSSKVQYGFQYFQYNSLAFSNNFDTTLGIVGYVDGQVANFRFNVYINGVKQTEEILIVGTVSRSFFVAVLSGVINRNYSLNDIVFITATNEGSALQLYVQTATLTFTSTYVKAYNLYRLQYDSLKGLPLLVTDSAGNFRTDTAGCPYNIEFVSPARCRDMWMGFFNSHFVDQVTGQMIFQTLDKNQFLETTVNGVTITEAANKTLLTQGRLFYPVVISFEFKCPLTFDEMQSRLSNAHVEIFISGVQFFVHILKIEQVGALNDTTTAVGLLSSKSDLSIFAKLTGFKIDI